MFKCWLMHCAILSRTSPWQPRLMMKSNKKSLSFDVNFIVWDFSEAWHAVMIIIYFLSINFAILKKSASLSVLSPFASTEPTIPLPYYEKRTYQKDPGLWGRYENIFSSNGGRKFQFSKFWILMKVRFSIFPFQMKGTL